MKTLLKLLTVTVFFIYFKTISFAQEEKNNSIIWKIEHPDNHKISYLFGTIHIIPKEHFFFTEKMKTAFDACQELILEIDINIPLAKQIAVAKDIFIPNGKSIADFLTPKEYVAFRKIIIEELGVKKSICNRSERIYPLFASGLFISDLIKKPVQYEKYLNKRAKKNKMTVSGLETIEFQMQTAKSITLEDQMKMFKDTVSLRKMKSDYDSLVIAYTNQDIDYLNELMQEDELTAGAENKLLSNRNKNWIPIIMKATKEKACFIAVGAGHLTGTYGLINLLRQKGYVVSKYES